jgi:Pyruvate/2-oxoacid:ferredoxin oxidoreductase delta subunit
MDIPEFYSLAEALFTPEEAEVCAAMPERPAPALLIAEVLGRDPEDVEGILEAMADKGLCSARIKEGRREYVPVPFVPGIFEFQFMRGTTTERDRRIARLIHAYKEAVDRKAGPPKITFPTERVIPIEKSLDSEGQVHTYDQVSYYIDHYKPIAVSTCFCRHEERLLDEEGHCGKPDNVCMQFGVAAHFVIDRKIGREVSKDEAREILRRSEEAGLVHTSRNIQEGIDFICNCCPCHCMILRTALLQPKPGLALSSGFSPVLDPDRCVGCDTCVERCPAQALSLGDWTPRVDLERCFGCGVCASGCPSEAIEMKARPDAPEPPKDRKALREALKSLSS